MNASDILQRYLDRIAAAVLQDDWPTYQDGVVLPFHLVTHSANITIATTAELRAGFEAFHQTLQAQKVTDYVRLVETAKQLDEYLITGRYITHLMAGAHRILEPYTSQITLRRQDGLWRAGSITNALANSRWPLLVPSVHTQSPKEGSSE